MGIFHVTCKDKAPLKNRMFFLDVAQTAFNLLRTHCHNKIEIQVEQDIIAAGTLKPPDCISDDCHAIRNVTELLAGRGKA